MKMIELEKMNLVPLSAQDSTETNGGAPWSAFFITYVLLEALVNPQAHIDAFVEGYKAAVKK